MQLLTLFCDASLCHKTGLAGWGAWAKHGGWDKGYLFGGGFKTPMASSNEAEICGIANALTHLANNDKLENIGQVMIQVDNLRALAVIKAYVPNTSERKHATGAPVHGVKTLPTAQEMKAVKHLRELVKDHDLKLIVRHVRGHQPGQSRNWVNRQCDEIAKTFMLQAKAGKVPEPNAFSNVVAAG